MQEKKSMFLLRKLIMHVLICVALFAFVACENKESEKETDETKLMEKLDITDCFMSVDGVKYTLPFKFSNLEKAGFDLNEYKATELAAKDSTHFSIVRHEIRYYFTVQNPNDSATNMMDCVVTYLELDVICYPKTDATIIEDVKYGTDEDKIIELSKKYTSNMSEREDGCRIYWLDSLNGNLGYKIFVSEDGMVYSFAVSNYDFSTVYPLEINKIYAEEITSTEETTIDTETSAITEEENTTSEETTTVEATTEEATTEETTTSKEIENRPPELMRFDKLKYENKYKSNDKITTISTVYSEGYQLSDTYDLESTVVLHMITQNLYEIDFSFFDYHFTGTMNAENEYCDIEFYYDFGLLGNNSPFRSEELECGEKVNLRNYQFPVYPGFYDFYQEGMNDFWYGSGDAVIMRTLTPDFNLSEEDNYIHGKDAWFEIKPNETLHIYVLLGTKEWYEKATSDLANLAMKLDKE